MWEAVAVSSELGRVKEDASAAGVDGRVGGGETKTEWLSVRWPDI